MSALVSVLMPAYNHEDYVQESIKSIISQTYNNIELVIIDDGSKDSTWEKIQEMKEECEKRFVRVIFETKNNEGTCATLTKLLSKAKGEYIFFTSSDDLLKPKTIEIELDFLEKNDDYVFVVGNNDIVDKYGNIGYWDKDRKLVYNKSEATYLTFVDILAHRCNFPSDFDKFGTYETLYYCNYIPNGYLIRKSIYDIIESYSSKAPIEDWFLHLQISKYSKMKYFDKILYSYRWHDNNTVQNNEKMAQMVKQTIAYEKEIWARIDETKVLPSVLKFKKYGVCYKKFGIPFVFQILSYRLMDNKRKVIKLFNIKVFEYKKKL